METELEKVKNEKVTLMLYGKEREIKFNFSVWAKLQEEYGSMRNFEKMERDMTDKPFSTLPHLIWIALQDKEGLTESTLLDEYGLGDIPEITKKLEKALYGSLPQDKKKVAKTMEKK